MQFHEHLKTIRSTANKTQQELAEYLNVSTQSVSKWELGQALPSIEYLPKMAKFFDCCVETFFDENILHLYEKFRPKSTHLMSFASRVVFEKKADIGDAKAQDEGELSQQTALLDAVTAAMVYDYLHKHKKAPVCQLQKSLDIGYAAARNIQDALRNIGIMDPEENPSNKSYGKIYKDKIDLLLPYFQ